MTMKLQSSSYLVAKAVPTMVLGDKTFTEIHISNYFRMLLDITFQILYDLAYLVT